MALKDTIKRNRKRLGLSVDDFARIMNVGVATAFRWENGSYDPTVKKLMSMAKLFGVTETELLHPKAENEENEDSTNVQ